VIYGGLARHPKITDDAIRLMVCHEIGHHLAGAPFRHRMDMTWAASEGQADYWSTQVCLKRVFRKDDNARLISRMKIDPLVEEKCREVFNQQEDVAICIRSSLAGGIIAQIFKEQLQRPGEISFATPDRSRVPWSWPRHPEPQCRLDTYFQGSLCLKEHENCTRSEGFQVGIRPLCWFKPE
jgi:hypothetical protein